MIGKYLVVYTEKEYDGDCGYDILLRNDDFNDIEKVKNHIAYLKAFEKERGFKFISVLRVKEISIVVLDSEIEKHREEQRLKDEENQREAKDKVREWEKAQLKRLKEKYER
jgi:hypothetical protein